LTREQTIGISEASYILGVSETSLRQWTDEGKVKAFITPGGHRRYSKLGLKRFMNSQQRVLGTRDLANELEESTAKHREVIAAFLRGSSWYNRLDEQSQKDLSSLGHNLLYLIIHSIIEPSKQDEILKEMRDIGFGFGEVLTRLKFPLTISTQAFIQHGDLIMSVTTDLLKKRYGLNPRLVETIPVINRALDEALVALMDAYQQNKDNSEYGKN
jgi:hypothetical protein